MKNKAEKFKTKGVNIIKGQQPQNMDDFIKDSLEHENDTQLHKNTFPQLHKTPVQHNKLGRLHLQIRQDLIGKLLDTVFKRKRDRYVDNIRCVRKRVWCYYINGI